MKKVIAILSVLSLVLFTGTMNAQKFEGKINYTIEYDDIPEEMAGYESMLPKEMSMKIKGNKSRTEQNTGMGTTVSIFNGDDKVAYTLMNMMGSKIAIKMEEADMKKEMENEPEPEIIYSDDTKTIAGYECKKAEVKYGEAEDVVVVYYTEEIQSNEMGSAHRGVKGFPMEYEISQNEMKITMTVKEVLKEKVAKSEFQVPSDYDEMTMEEFTKMMSGAYGGEH